MKTKHIYLTAYYLQRPRDPKKTYIKGYITDPNNMIWDENVEISHGLGSKDRQHAQVVLDFTEKKVIANKFNQERDFDKLFKYYFEGYHKYITQVMSQMDPEYLTKMVAEMQSELDNQPEQETTDGLQSIQSQEEKA